MNEYKTTIYLKSNLHIGSGFAFMSLVDKTTIKDQKGFVIIPGATFKGKLRSICKKICLSLESEFGQICEGKDSPKVCKSSQETACIICRLFGSAYNEGKLIFRDATLLSEDREKIEMIKKLDHFASPQSELRSGNRISRLLRTSSSKQLFVSESCPRDLIFEGKIFNREALKDVERKLLRWGAKSLLQIGGQKGRGLGRVSVTIEGM
ncbi:MAG: RAMP superfamily CRISPR-associated protein [Candidatus Scalindua sp.]|nr:RAMP superfamily CRISPR-associated protein [Candidatus Scalindua sp.]